MIRDCDIILVHKKSIDSLDSISAPVIRKLTGCYYNHVAIIAEYLGELYIIESVSKGFVPTKKLSDYLLRRDVEIIVLRPIEKISKQEIYKNLNEIAGKGYSFTVLLWHQLWFQLMKRYGWKYKGHTGEHAKGRLVCSQSVAYAYKSICPKWWEYTGATFFNLIDKNYLVIFESNLNERKKFYERLKK